MFIGELIVFHHIKTTKTNKSGDIVAAPIAPFSGVVIDHIEINFHTLVVESFDHGLKFSGGSPGGAIISITAIGGEITKGHVTPIVTAGAIVGVIIVSGFLDR